MWVTFVIQNWKTILGAVLIVGSFLTGYFKGSDSVKRDWDLDIHLRVKEQLAFVEKNQKLIVALEETKNENLKIVNQLADVTRAVRVRVPTTACVRSTPTPSRSEDVPAASGVVPATSQETFDSFRSGLESDALEADRIVEDCRVVVDWAKEQER